MNKALFLFLVFSTVFQNVKSQEIQDSLSTKVRYFLSIGCGEEFSLNRNPASTYNLYKSEVSLGGNSTQITVSNGVSISNWKIDATLTARKIKEVKNVSSYMPLHPHVSRNIVYDFWGFGFGATISKDFDVKKDNVLNLFLGLSYFQVSNKIFADQHFIAIRPSDSVEVEFTQKASIYKSSGRLLRFGLSHSVKTKVGNIGLMLSCSIQPVISVYYSVKQNSPSIGFESNTNKLNRGYLGFGVVYSWNRKK